MKQLAIYFYSNAQELDSLIFLKISDLFNFCKLLETFTNKVFIATKIAIYNQTKFAVCFLLLLLYKFYSSFS
jgi:hypothetical protein